jgi:hypothetical protein
MTIADRRARERQQAEKRARILFEKFLANAQRERFSVLEVGGPLVHAFDRIYYASEQQHPTGETK